MDPYQTCFSSMDYQSKGRDCKKNRPPPLSVRKEGGGKERLRVKGISEGVECFCRFLLLELIPTPTSQCCHLYEYIFIYR
jgi:hypothetical protein